MAQPTNTQSTYGAVGIREGLSDAIFRMAHEKTNFLSMIGREDVPNTYTEWQTETLSAPDLTNAVVEGDDATNDAMEETVRVGNRTQLMDKTIVVSSTADAVNRAGKATETGHQIARKGVELKKDLEAIILSNQASVTGSDSVARKLGSFPAWLTTNVMRSTGATPGANGGFSGGNVAAATDGTVRALNINDLIEVFTKCYDAGSEPSIVQVSPRVKVKMSQFLLSGNARIATLSHDTPATGQAAAIAAVDYYESDFGPKRVQVNIHQRNRDVFVIDPEYLALGVLQGFEDTPLAKTGHSNRRMLSVESTLIVKNEAAHGIVADIDHTAAAVQS